VAHRSLVQAKQRFSGSGRPTIIRIGASRQEALAKLQSRKGQAYLKTVEQKLAAFEQPCLQDSNGDQTKFEMELSVGEKGKAELAQSEQRPTAFSSCVMRGLYQSFLKKGDSIRAAAPRLVLVASGA
jgi:hypothetical protein